MHNALNPNVDAAETFNDILRRPLQMTAVHIGSERSAGIAGARRHKDFGESEALLRPQ